MTAHEVYTIEENSVQSKTQIQKSILVLKSSPEDPFELTLEALSTRSKKNMQLKDPLR